MTVSTPAPILARPSVGTLRLRSGEHVLTITGGPHRVLVRRTHAEALLDDIEDAIDQIGDQ